MSEKILTMYFNHAVLSPEMDSRAFVRLIWIRILVIAGTKQWRKEIFYKCEKRETKSPIKPPIDRKCR